MSESQINVTLGNARRLTHTARGMSCLEEIKLKPLNSNEILVKTAFSGISRGTERLVYEGKVPTSEQNRMRCPNQVGDFSYPISYGYACVGIVVAVGNEVSAVSIGDAGFCLHPHQDLFAIEETGFNKLPTDLPLDRAVLSANMETALNAIWDSGLRTPVPIAVIGCGVVGLLTAYLAKTMIGCSPILIDTDSKKQAITEHLGLSFSNPTKALSSKTEFGVVIHTSASEAGLQTAIELCGFEGKIIEMSWYGDKSVTLNLGGAFHSKRLQIISSQVGHVSPVKRATTTYADRLQLAMSHLISPELDALLHPRVELSDLPAALSGIFDHSSDALCPLVTYSNNE